MTLARIKYILCGNPCSSSADHHPNYTRKIGMLKRIIFIFTSLVCLLNILLWPVNEYEWMLEEDPGMSLPIDHDAGIVAFFAMAPILFLLLFLIKQNNDAEKKYILSVFSALLGLWLYKYWDLVWLSP